MATRRYILAELPDLRNGGNEPSKAAGSAILTGMADAPETKLRWYRLTPNRLVLGLLAVEAFLLLSNWGGWFPFNQHKGWTVLMAVAAVGLTFLWMLLWFAAALLFRCRFQYSLRSLLSAGRRRRRPVQLAGNRDAARRETAGGGGSDSEGRRERGVRFRGARWRTIAT